MRLLVGLAGVFIIGASAVIGWYVWASARRGDPMSNTARWALWLRVFSGLAAGLLFILGALGSTDRPMLAAAIIILVNGLVFELLARREERART